MEETEETVGGGREIEINENSICEQERKKTEAKRYGRPNQNCIARFLIGI